MNLSVQYSDPLSLLVQSISNELISQLASFGQRCRKYLAKNNQQNPDFNRYLSKQNVTIANPIVPNVIAPLPNSQGVQSEYKRMPKQVKPRRKDDDEVPHMVKKPRNAYNIFVASESVKIKEQHPHMRAPDIVRIAAERYNNMSEQQKRPYVQKFEEAKRFFEEQQNDMMRYGINAPVRRGRGRGARYDYTIK